jgi:hypothetical protein
MAETILRVALVFSPDDQAWLRREQVTVPPFWHGHGVPPAAGDVLRIAGRQFLVQGRAWEHDGQGTVLRVFVGNAHAQSDTVFG